MSDVSSTLLLDDAFREIAYSSQIGTLQWQSGLDYVLGASGVEVRISVHALFNSRFSAIIAIACQNFMGILMHARGEL